MSVSDFHLGQSLFIVYSHMRFSPKTLEVTKIGRRWITVGKGWQAERIDAETMSLDGKGYSSPGSAYLSREDWELTTTLFKEWEQLKRDMPWRPTDGMTVQLIRHARTTLGLPPLDNAP